MLSSDLSSSNTQFCVLSHNFKFPSSFLERPTKCCIKRQCNAAFPSIQISYWSIIILSLFVESMVLFSSLNLKYFSINDFQVSFFNICSGTFPLEGISRLGLDVLLRPPCNIRINNFSLFLCTLVLLLCFGLQLIALAVVCAQNVHLGFRSWKIHLCSHLLFLTLL